MLEKISWQRLRWFGVAIFLIVATTISLVTAAGSNAAVFSFVDSVNRLIGNGPGTTADRMTDDKRAFAPAPQPTCLPAPGGLISWWRGEDNATDQYGGNSGTLIGGATYAAGKVGRAFSLNGVTAAVDVPDDATLHVTTEFTIGAWVNPAVVPNYPNGALVISKVGGLSNLNGFQMAITNVSGANVIWCGFNEGGGWPGHTVTGGNVPTGTWSYVACTYDHNTQAVYQDGQQVGSTVVGPVTVASTTSHIKIGSDDVGQQFFSGLIDEPVIFGRGLTSTEILSIYNAGSSGICVPQCTAPPSGMVSWWAGENNASDITGNHNGTLTGTAAYGAGMKGRAFSFDGSQGGYMEVPDSPSLSPTDAFTIDGWFYIDPNAPRGGNDVGTLAGKSTGELNSNWSIYFDDRDGTKRLRFVMGANVSYANAIPAPNWYHVAGTYDSASSPRAKLYLNGNLVADSGSELFAVSPNHLPLRIGAMNWTDTFGVGNDRLNGRADEVEFYNVALTQTDIQNIYNSRAAGTCRPDIGKAYIANSGSETVSVVDIASGSVDATISTGSPRNPTFIAVSNDGTRAYVPHVYASDISVIDTATNTVIGSFSVPGTMHGLAVNVAGTRLYVSHRDASEMWVLDASNGALLATIPIGPNPFGIAAAPNGAHVYTANYGGSVSAVSTADNSVVSITTGSNPYGVAVSPDSSKVYVSNNGSGSVSVIDAATNTVTATIPFNCPSGVAVNKAGTKVYVGGCGTDILAINTADNSATAIPVGVGTQGVSVSQDGSHVIAAAPSANAIVSINTTNNAVATTPVGSSPYSLGQFIAQGLPVTPACIPPPSGLVSWWPGENNVVDVKGGNIGTPVNGTSFAAGKVGKAFNFDGVDDYISIPHNPSLNTGAQITIDAWVYRNTATLGATIFQKRSPQNIGGYVFEVTGDDVSRLQFVLMIGGVYHFATSPSVLTIGTWQHVAATYDGQSMKIYVDGNEVVSVPQTGTIDSTQDPIVIGQNVANPQFLWNGRIDEVQLFNRALSHSEIQAIYTAGSAGNCRNSTARADFDGDGKTDLSVFRPSEGNWYVNRSTSGFLGVKWGMNGDTVVPGDYDGDGKADFAVYRPYDDANFTDFYILSSNGYNVSGYSHGMTTDQALPGDFDGDGKSDIVVWRPATGMWYVYSSLQQTTLSVQFGAPGDIPFVMDNDGDGKDHMTVYRPSERRWYIARPVPNPAQNFDSMQWGLVTDIPVPADYDGDGKDDIAVFRPSNGFWYIYRSSDGQMDFKQFGLNGDVPVPGDYDGDGKTDVAVYRGGMWYINGTTSGFSAEAFGLPTDKPVPGAYHP